MPGVPEEGYRDEVSGALSLRLCCANVYRDRRTRFATFPEVLVVHAKKFQLVNWVPSKLGECA